MVRRRRAGEIPDTLILLEHPPTYTVGRGGSAANILLDDAARAAAGIDLEFVDRGGDATYHGPGQLVAYPIVDLRERRYDVHAFLRDLESTIQDVLFGYGVVGERDDRFTGVWVGSAKIAAIGVKVSGGITSHGFALNVAPDMTHWTGIVPCGIRDRSVTSLAILCPPPPSIAEVTDATASAFSHRFGLTLETAPVGALNETNPMVGVAS
jgi:lipoate-protein ligase B